MATRKDDKGSDDPAEQAAHQASDIGRRTAEYARHSTSELGDFGSQQVRAFLDASTRAARDFGDLSGGDGGFFMQNGTRLAKGMQDISWLWVQYTQNSLNMGLLAASRMMGCRTIEELLELQRDFLKDSVDGFLRESARLLEMTSNIAGDTINPIAERIQTHTQQP